MISFRGMTTADRRTTLAGLAGAGAGCSLRGAAAKLGARNPAATLGGWSIDAHGLPAYVFAGNVPVETRTPSGHPYPLEPDPVFMLGNSDLTLFAFASGRLLFVSGERGWVRLNEPTPTTPGHAATLMVTGGGAARTYDLLGLGGVGASGRRAMRSFGCGTARYRLTPEPDLTVERILSVAPSKETQRAQPAVVVTVRLTNTGLAPLDLDYDETVLSNPTLLANHAPIGGVRPVRFVNAARLLPGGRGVICDAAAASDDPSVLSAIDAPNAHNLFPPSLVLANAAMAGGAPVEFEHRTEGAGAVALSARSCVRLAPGATRDVVLVIALKSQEAPLAAIEGSASGRSPG